MTNLSKKVPWTITINDGIGPDFKREFQLSENLSVHLLFELITKHLEALDFAEDAFKCRDFSHLLDS